MLVCQQCVHAFGVPGAVGGCRVLLVQHIEDVGQIITALREARYKHLTRKGFRSLMYDTLGNRAMVRTVRTRGGPGEALSFAEARVQEGVGASRV